MKGLVISVLLIAALGIGGWYYFPPMDVQKNPGTILPETTITNAPTATASPVPLQKSNEIVITPAPTNDSRVRKVGQYTYTESVGCDSKMATANDVYVALNNYRQAHGSGPLAWSDKLASVGQMRAGQVVANGGHSDEHAGFFAYTNDQSNFAKVGFGSLAENIEGGSCSLFGVHIIEWIFAADAPHNDNQLDPSWQAVGIGVDHTVVSVIFGKDPI